MLKLKREHALSDGDLADGLDRGTTRSGSAFRLIGACAAAVLLVTVWMLASTGGASRREVEGSSPTRLAALQPDVTMVERVLPSARRSSAPPSRTLPDSGVSEYAQLEDSLPGLGVAPAHGDALYDPSMRGGAHEPMAQVRKSARQEMAEQRELDWEQRRFEDLEGALVAPIRGSATAAWGTGESASPLAPRDDAPPAGLAMLEQSLATLAQGAREQGPQAGGADDGVAPADARKVDFFQRGGAQLGGGRIEGQRRSYGTPYVLQQGAFFPAALETPIHSDLPGQIRGRITQNVYDSAELRHLLIPSGAMLVGTYSSEVSQGQERVQVAWTRLNFPDGTYMDLGSMPGGGVGGLAGLKDRVNRHFGRVLGAALMMAAPMVTYELTMPTQQQSVEGAVHRGVGNSVLEVASKLAEREIDIPPTLEIRRGTRFTVHVNKDVTFDGPYEDGHAWRRR